DAGKAFERRRWTDAASGYREAAAAWTQLEAELAAAAAAAEELVRARAAARAEKSVRAGADDDATRLVPAAEKSRTPVYAGAGAALAAALALGAWLWLRDSAPDAPPVEPRREARVEPQK